MTDETELLSTKDVCRIFRVNRVTVADWANSGRLPSIKTLGGHSRFRKEEIVDFLRTNRLPIPPELQPDRPLILLADDEPSILKTFPRRILARYPGARVDTADNGVEALLKIGREVPGLILLDLLMPKMDGIEVIHRLKSEPTYAGIKILAISGYVKDEKAVLKAGADAFFQKGSDLKGLIESLQEYLPSLKLARDKDPAVDPRGDF
ncbi:response regulator [bacterium]|nr:response regulator [bacterium]